MGQISSKVVELPEAFEGLRRSGASQTADGSTESPQIARPGEAGTDSSCSSTCGELEPSPSNLALSQGLSQIRGEVARQSRSLHQLTGTTYETFLSSIQELNEIAGHFLDSNGKLLVFTVKKGTDATVFWKATVRVAIVKIDAETKKVDTYRCVNLRQYLKVYNALKTQAAAVKEFDQGDIKSFVTGQQSESVESCSTNPNAAQSKKYPSTSNTSQKPYGNTRLVDIELDPKELIERVTAKEIDPNSLDECCICLERKPDVILPCTHSYCLPCIEQWNVDHKTCPVCRETLDSTDDGWVISEGPDALDIATDIQKSLMSLADD